MDPPGSVDSRGNTFEMTLAADGDHWECEYQRKGSGGVWKGRRVGAGREKGSKLSTEGVARDRAVFDRLVAPKDTSKAKAEREAVLSESVRFAAAAQSGALGSRMDALVDEAPSLAVGDPYDDAASKRHRQSSRTRGKQLVGGSTSRLRAEMEGSATRYVACPYEDRATISRRLRREARERSRRLAAKDAGTRPPFAPPSRDAGLGALTRAPTLSSVPPGTAGKALFEIARKAREEASRPRERAAPSDKDRPPYCSSAAPSQGPIARQRHTGLGPDATDDAAAAAAAAEMAVTTGKDRRLAASAGARRAGDERAAFRVSRASPLDRQAFIALVPTAEQVAEHERRRKAEQGSRPLSAPLRPRSKVPPPKADRPPFSSRVSASRAPATPFEHFPEGSPALDGAARRAAAGAAAERAAAAFRPTGPRKSRLTQTVALRPTNLRRPATAAAGGRVSGAGRMVLFSHRRSGP